VCTGRKPLIISPLRETDSASVAAVSCRRGPAEGGSPESPHGASSRHGAKLVVSARGVETGDATRFSRSGSEGRPQQQEACRHRVPHLQIWAWASASKAAGDTESADATLTWRTSASARSPSENSSVLPHGPWVPLDIGLLGYNLALGAHCPLNLPRRCRSGAKSSEDCGSNISVATRPIPSPVLATETCGFPART
jgi:hypothetical protein